MLKTILAVAVIIGLFFLASRAGAMEPDKCMEMMRNKRPTALERYQGPKSNYVKYPVACRTERMTTILGAGELQHLNLPINIEFGSLAGSLNLSSMGGGNMPTNSLGEHFEINLRNAFGVR